MRTYRDIYELLAAADGQDRLFTPRAALATITRTVGATFRRPGSRMLVTGDGRRVRGLSGGCPEADITARALRAIQSGVAELVRYDREHGLDALIELGCGGELEVLIEPIGHRGELDFLDLAARCWSARREGWLATVYARDGACLPRPRRALWQEGWKLDQLGAPTLLAQLSALAQRKLDTALCAHAQLDTAQGQLDVLLEALRPPVHLLVAGINPVAQALASLAARLGWSATLLHHTNEPPSAAADLPLLCAPPERLATCVPCDARTYCAVMTHNLERDIAYAGALLATPAPYIGVLASRRRSAEVLARLREDGRHPDGRVFAPAGLDIGSEDPDEIALSLLAQMKAFENRKSGAPLAALDTPIH
jgi:xanthine dehydrogenase accessory factor